MENKMPSIHPGEILKEELEELNISARLLAKNLGVPNNRITEILKGKRAVTSDTALCLGRYFGTSAEFWLNLQLAYDLKITKQIKGDEIEMAVQPLHSTV
jgi:addiction module HigA family antidote